MNDKSGKGSIAQYLDLGFQFAISILLGVGGGYWLDSKIGTRPVFLIIGLLVGATAGFLNLYRTVYPPDSHEGTDGEGKH